MQADSSTFNDVKKLSDVKIQADSKIQADVIFSARWITDEWVKGKTVVVIDILRATSSMVTALANGAKEITPCLSTAEAFSLIKGLDQEACLLCGERNAMIIDGFDLGNSPLDFTRDKVAGRSLIATTTNGTKAILAASPADQVVIAGILNSGAVAEFLEKEGKDAIIICAGTRGEVSFDDLLGAGCIIDKWADRNKDLSLSDSAQAVRSLYRQHRENLAEGLLQAAHAKKLFRLGLLEDIRYCAQEDLFDIIPVYREGKIKKLSQSLT